MEMQRNDPVDRIPLFVSALNGAILVPSFMAIPADMPVNLRLSMLLLVLSMLSAALSSFLTSGLRGRAWGRCVGDGLLSAATFFLSGIIPLLFSAVLPDRFDRIQFLVGVTFIMVGAILVVYLVMRDKKMIPLIPQDAPFPWLVFSIGMVGSVLVVLLAGKINGLRSELFKDTYGCGGYNTTTTTQYSDTEYIITSSKMDLLLWGMVVIFFIFTWTL